ncbi:MAG: CvpA family protein [Paludibacteraceae bacterium]|nr:CvpA family protein [Paludibacteraceae bacterium]
MIALDILFLIILAIGLIRGASRGLVMELSGLLGLIVSIFVAKNYSEVLMGKFFTFFGIQAEVSHFISFIIVLLLSLVVIHFLAILISRFIKLVMLDWLNKLGGAVFSGIKYLLILGAILYAFERMNNVVQLVEKEEIEKSKLYSPIKSTAYLIFSSATSANS